MPVCKGAWCLEGHLSTEESTISVIIRGGGAQHAALQVTASLEKPRSRKGAGEQRLSLLSAQSPRSAA